MFKTHFSYIDTTGGRTLVTKKEDKYFIIEGSFIRNEKNKDSIENIEEEQLLIKNNS